MTAYCLKRVWTVPHLMLLDFPDDVLTGYGTLFNYIISMW